MKTTVPGKVAPADWQYEIVGCVASGKPVRQDLPGGGRIHIDRPLPFLCIHISADDTETVAREIAQANASYLIAPDVRSCAPLIKAVIRALEDQFGGVILFVIGELDGDKLLTDDAPFLPPFEISVWATNDAREASAAFEGAVSATEVRYRTPRLLKAQEPPDMGSGMSLLEFECPTISAHFAPIHRQAGSGVIYPELRERLVALLFDAGLRAVNAFIGQHEILKLTSHRSLGRKAFIDAVTKLDRNMDEVASSFDFLLMVTPINAEEAYRRFEANNYRGDPQFLYRPLPLQIDAVKRKLFSASFDHLEDPVLYNLYREKQQELDLQLSLISSRQTPQFIEFGRALYGPVEPILLREANAILQDMETRGAEAMPDRQTEADCFFVERRARTMAAAYRKIFSGFDITIELRDDLPSGLLVSGDRLLISRTTSMDVHRVEPLLAHEIGVHLLTYFNGSSQGLRLFRTGLAGYEGMQEGLAVFSEYLAGGMTRERLKLIAGRVVGCAAMLEGASFDETFALMVKEHDFAMPAAFNLVLRLYRGGGLAKDAIYLRGLLELLDHLKNGGVLEPFWMGKIAASHFGVMQELATRGLLRRPMIYPLFIEHPLGQEGLKRAKSGIRPIDMLQERNAT